MSATLLNLSALGRDLDMPQTTLKRYLSLLRATFLVDLLPAWSANLGKRLVKSPKVHLVDTGVAAAMLGLGGTIRRDDPRWGPLLESFVVGELRKLAGHGATLPRLFHFRSHAGDEVDVVLEDARGDIVAVEVKASRAVGAAAFRTMRLLADRLGARFRRGVVLHLGERAVAFGDRLYAVPVTALFR